MAVGTIRSDELWPGFNPASIPVAAFDGEQTLLARFPSMPPGFLRVPGTSDLSAMSGRHPAVIANTAIEIEGTVAAAVILNQAGRPAPDSLAALIVHEAFHVFQRWRYPGWGANEADLFAYPVEDPINLALGRLETTALQRALDAKSIADVAMWAGAALGLREERIKRLPRPARAYEQETERYEGLARYVEWSFAPGDQTTVIPNSGFAPADTRRRCYATGLALALLLDQLRPGWAETLNVNPTETLDALLTPHVARRKSFTAAEREAAMARAEADVGALHAEQTALRDRLLTRPGWRLEIVADPIQPLMPRGFDPMNCTLVGPGEVIHHRYLRLGNATDHVELFGIPALSSAAGTHPLFDGVARLVVPGLNSEPVVVEQDGLVRIKAEGIEGTFWSVEVERSTHAIRVRHTDTP